MYQSKILYSYTLETSDWWWTQLRAANQKKIKKFKKVRGENICTIFEPTVKHDAKTKIAKKAFLCFLNCIFNNLFHAWSTPNQLLVWFVYQFSNNCVFNALHNVLKRIKMCWFKEVVCNKPMIDIMQWEKGRSSVDTKLQITIKFDKIWAAFYAISRQYKNSTFVWLF